MVPARYPRIPPKGRIKFACFDPSTGNRSSVWIVKTGKDATKDDVYLMEETTGRAWKTTLHNGWGTWHIAMTGEAAEELGVERPKLDSWSAPEPIEGWRDGVSVVFPCSSLRWNNTPLALEVTRIRISPAHSGLAVRLMLREPDAQAIEPVDPDCIVAELLRANGGSLFVVAEAFTLTHEMHRMIERHRRDFRERNAIPDAPHRFVGAVEAAGHRFLVDLAAD